MVPRGAGKKGFDNYPCTQETEACPICENGDTPSLVYAFTVLDHREYKDKNGKLHANVKKLYICKKETFKRLQMKAEKNNGIDGVTFDVSRIGEKSASVGSDYDVVGKFTVAQIAEGCDMDVSDLAPFDYGDNVCIRYYPAAELRKMGFGVGSVLGSADKAAMSTEHKAPENTGAVSPFKSKSFNASKEL